MSATEKAHDPVFTTIDMGAEARKAWGPEWGKPPVSYRFGKREFTLRTEDASIYSSSPDF